MKKVLIAIVVLLVSKLSFGQDVKFGIKAGVNLAELEAKSGGVSMNTESLTNFQVGGFAEFDFANLSIQPGLVLNGKGGKVSEDGAEVKTSLMYLEIPVNLNYNFPVGFGKIYLGAGPYAAFGIGGKIKSSGFPDEEDNGEEDVEFGSGDEEVKGTDFGLNFGGGVRLTNGVNLGVNYGLGLSNLNNDGDGKVKNRVWGLTVGYFF